MLIVVVAQSFSGERAINYVLPVLWMTSCFHIMGPIGQNQGGGRYVSFSLPGGGTRAKLLPTIAGLLIWG